MRQSAAERGEGKAFHRPKRLSFCRLAAPWCGRGCHFSYTPRHFPTRTLARREALEPSHLEAVPGSSRFAMSSNQSRGGAGSPPRDGSAALPAAAADPARALRAAARDAARQAVPAPTAEAARLEAAAREAGDGDDNDADGSGAPSEREDDDA